MDRKEQIIIEANKLFFEKDFEKVSLNQIAKKLGMTKGGIYHYFNSKHDLLIEVMRYNFQQMETIAYNHINKESTTYEMIAGFFDLDTMKKEVERINTTEDIGTKEKNQDFNMEHFYYFIFMLAIKNEEVKDEMGILYEKSIKMIGVMIEKGQEKKEIRNDVEANVIAVQIVALIEGLMFLTIFNNTNPTIRDQQKIFDSFWKQIKN